MQYVKMFSLKILWLLSCVFLSESIIGGEDAPLRKFTYQVSLQYKGGNFCGGSIISESWILTAAHCIYKINITVVTGTIFKDTGDRYAIKNIIVHEGFSFETGANDIAVIQLENHIKFNVYTQPIRLSFNDPLPGIYATVTGWGYTDV